MPSTRSRPAGRPFLVLLLGLLLGLPLTALTALTALAAPASAASGVLTATATATSRPWPGHRDRRLVPYRVRRGDTAAGIAQRFHAWTAELRRINHKSVGSTWYVGERVTVPVVVSHTARAKRARASRAARAARHTAQATTIDVPRATRTHVRAVVVRTAKRYHVPPSRALAVAWHESGWQQQVRSSAGALGVMQVMPSNRRYLSLVAGRPLRLRDLEDNVTAGVLLLQQLGQGGHSLNYVLAGYYQGTGTLAEHGLYRSTKVYIANVRANLVRLRHGWRPDR